MGEIRTAANSAYRDYEVDGVPASGAYDPPKPDVRAVFGAIEDRIDQVAEAAGAFIPFLTKAAMDADLDYDAGTVARVYGDGTPANDGYYTKSGASGSGSWGSHVADPAIQAAADAAAAQAGAEAAQADTETAQAGAEAAQAAAEDAADEAAGAAAQLILSAERLPEDSDGVDGSWFVSTVDEGQLIGPKRNGTWAFANILSFAGVVQREPALPANMLAAWYMQDYDADTAQVPNALSATALSANVLRASQEMFDSLFWDQSGVTLTPQSDGTFRMQGTGDAYVFPVEHLTPPAGSYTIVVEARVWGGGADQTVKADFSTDSTTGDMTFTASYSRQSVTATLASVAQTILAIRTKTTDWDLQVRGIWLYPGTSDPGEPAQAMHLQVGKSAYDSANDCADGVLNLAGGRTALVQSGSDLNLDNWTVHAIVSKSGAGQTYNALFGSLGSYITFTPMLDQDGMATAFYGSQTLARSQAVVDGLQIHGKGWKAFSLRYNRSTNTTSIFLNGVRLQHEIGGATPSSVTLRNLLVGALQDLTNTGDIELAALAIADEAQTDDEVRAAQSFLASHSLVTLDTDDKFLFGEGDSITANNPSYLRTYYGPNQTQDYFIACWAVAGATLDVRMDGNDVQSRLPILGAGLASQWAASQSFYYSCLIGANEWNGLSTTDFRTALNGHAANVQDLGMEFWAITCLPMDEGTHSGWSVKRAQFNSDIVTDYGAGLYDRIVRFDLNATMGADSAASPGPTARYPDKIHPDATGQAALEPDFRDVANA